MKITIFDVGYGSSVLVELPSKNNSKIGIIDCYIGKKKDHPLLRKLKEIEADTEKSLSIEFLIITHHHTDHFLGIKNLINEFGDRIKKIYDPGINPKQLMVIEYPYDKSFHTNSRQELAALMKYQTHNSSKYSALASPNTVIYEDTINNLEIRSIAPEGFMLKKSLETIQKFFTKIQIEYKKSIDFSKSLKTPPSDYDLNKTSSAIKINYKDKTIILGGDVLNETWENVRQQDFFDKADVFLLSHHGAKNAFPIKCWHSIFKEKANIFVSCNGKSHPASNVIDFLRKKSTPFWTTNVVPERLKKDWLRHFVETFHYNSASISNPEQGNIECTISDLIKIEGPRFH